jgi:putative ABC transport system permease protein
MSLFNLLKIALRSIAKNKLRSFLTMLGIIIGVAAVISMLAIAKGAQDMMQAQISSLGTNVMIIFPSATASAGVRSEAGSGQKLTEEDAQALDNCSSVLAESPLIRTQAQVIFGAQNWRTTIMGAYFAYFQVRDLKLQSGNLYTKSDERSASKVCVIGQTVSDNLFGAGVSPIGQTIRIKNIPFIVIGLLVVKGQNAFGQDQDDIVLCPFATVQKRMTNGTNVQQILASAKTEPLIPQATSEITEMLRARHKIQPSDDNDFTIRTQSEIGDAAKQQTQTMTVLLASIASISLLVGGIGIMNIMLVSVTERTREIGIRMSIGARGRDVLRQFLLESIMLSLVGGVFGVILGYFASKGVSNLQGWPVTISAESVAMSFGFALFIGVFFGWYPARKAANMNPIEALRYE